MVSRRRRLEAPQRSPVDRFGELLGRIRDVTASTDERRDACRTLAFEVDDPRVDVLLDVLRPEQPFALRYEAVYGLGNLRDARAFDPFCRIIRDRGENATLRSLAAELVSNFEGVDAVPTLIDALSDREPMVRFDAAWSLALVGDGRARDALEAHLDDVENPHRTDENIGEVVRRALDRIGPRSRRTGKPTSPRPSKAVSKRTSSGQRAPAATTPAPIRNTLRRPGRTSSRRA